MTIQTGWLELPEHQAQGSPAHGALAGIKVVDFSHFLAGPLATMMLGDLGAQVVKIESPGRGDEFRHFGPMHPDLPMQGAPFIWANRNKRSLALNLKGEAGREVARELIRGADVLVENFSAKVMQRLGFDYDTCKALNPRLVYCSVSAYGRDGAFADRFGFDPIIQAESGIISMNGYPDREGVRNAAPMVDISTAMMASNMILAALIARGTSGVGQRVEVSLYETGMVMTGFAGMQNLFSGKDPQRNGNNSPDSSPTGVFQASDRAFYINCASTRIFERLCRQVLNRPDLAGDDAYRDAPARLANRQQLVDLLQSAFGQHPWSYWGPLMFDAGIPCGPLRTVGEAMTAPETVDRKVISRIPHPVVGWLPNIASPMHLSGNPLAQPTPAPALGGDTEQVLAEMLGYNDDRIAQLRAAGAFGAEPPAT